jgi:uncharacterized protein (TIGR03437 family)
MQSAGSNSIRRAWVGAALLLGSAFGQTGTIERVAGQPGEAGYTGHNGPATSAMLNTPSGLAMDIAGNLYISDLANCAIRKVTPEGEISTFVGGQVEMLPVAAPAPAPVTLGPECGANPKLAGPAGIAIDAGGNFYVANFGNHTISQISSDGRRVTRVAGTGQAGFSGDGIPALNSMLNHPKDVAIGPDGLLYIADKFNHRVRRREASGILTTFAGSGLPGYSGDGGPAVRASLNVPIALAFHGENLYINEQGNNMVRRVTAGIISRVAGRGPAGSEGDGGPATQALLADNLSVDLDANGSLYIAQAFDGRIRQVTPQGNICTIAGLPPVEEVDVGSALNALLRRPAAVLAAANGDLYLAEETGHVVRRIVNAGGGGSEQARIFVSAPAEDFRAAPGHPVTIDVTVSQGCMASTDEFTVAALFSNGDPPVQLVNPSGGRWVGTWFPRNPQVGEIKITILVRGPNIARQEERRGALLSPSADFPVIFNGGVQHAAGFAPGPPVAPGTLISIHGRRLSLSEATATGLPLPLELAGVTASLAPGSYRLGLRFVGERQIDAVVPRQVAPGRYTLLIRRSDSATADTPLLLAEAAPAILTVDDSGQGQGRILNQSGDLADSRNPAEECSAIQIFATGLGGEFENGQLQHPVGVTIHGTTTAVQSARPVLPFAGLYQVDAVVPDMDIEEALEVQTVVCVGVARASALPPPNPCGESVAWRSSPANVWIQKKTRSCN